MKSAVDMNTRNHLQCNHSSTQ